MGRCTLNNKGVFRKFNEDCNDDSVAIFLVYIFYTSTLLSFFSPVTLAFSILISFFSICQSHKLPHVVTGFDKITVPCSSFLIHVEVLMVSRLLN